MRYCKASTTMRNLPKMTAHVLAVANEVGLGVMNLLTIVGSRDWTLRREKIIIQTLSLAKRFYDDALAWLVSDGHAKSVEVEVWEEKPNQMGRKIIITLVDGSKFEVTP